MNSLAYVTILYGVLVLIGGLIGYFKASSTPSLVMGSIFGVLLILCGLGMPWQYNWALSGTISLAVILALFFGYRYLSTGAIFPAGFMMFVSLAMLIFCLVVTKWK